MLGLAQERPGIPKQLRHRRRHRPAGDQIRSFERKQMMEAQLRIAQNPKSFIQLRVCSRRTTEREIFLPQPFRIEPGPSRFTEEREVVGHAEKLSPQAQVTVISLYSG